MAIGITNTTNASIDKIIEITNATNITGIMQNVNTIIYNGYLYFTLLWLIWLIVVISAQKVRKNLLVNSMYASAFVSILGFFFRILSFITGAQMWMFPTITLVLAAIVWALKE